MEIKGKIIHILQPVSGISKTGNEWRKQEFVIETAEEQFPKQICFTLFNDKVTMLESLTQGAEVSVSFSLESREFNGRWYHNVNAWKIDKLSTGSSAGDYPPFATSDIPPTPEDDENDLPF